MDILEKVGMEKYVKHKPSELSGGQIQRVAIARALVKEPELVLADEPTANLDTKTALSIIELMKKLNEEYNKTFLFSTQDVKLLQYVKKCIKIEDYSFYINPKFLYNFYSIVDITFNFYYYYGDNYTEFGEQPQKYVFSISITNKM